MTCTQDCNQGRHCKCDVLLAGIVQTTRNAGCCNIDPLPDDHPGGWERAAYWAAVGLGAGFAAALVFFAPAAWVWAKVGGPTLRLMRAAAVQMENWFVACEELREEAAAATRRINEQDAALHALADVFHHAAKFARLETTLDAFGTGVIDKVPFLNAMAAHGRNSVGAPLPERKKKKVAA